MSTKLEELKWKKFEVLSDGFVCLVDMMGDDSSIVQAARVSYGEGTKHTSDDRNLIRYLMRHRHCYSPWMQVLTKEGWKRWDECNSYEYFAVPNPQDRTLKFEWCELKRFRSDDGLYTFNNNRMSYAVTPDHKMWFKNKYKDHFDLVKVQDMLQWGHFDVLGGYCLKLCSDDWNNDLQNRSRLVGFYLGDGSFASVNCITFHLKKLRKQEYLRRLIAILNLDATERQSATYEDAVVFSIAIPDWFSNYFTEEDLSARSCDKKISIWNLDNPDWVCGIMDGLSQSDGSDKHDRPQITFSSSSPYLISLWEAVNSVLGFDAHQSVRKKDGTFISTAYYGDRTTLEARKQYFGFEEYNGEVFCATTSTGLLMVRGGPDKFAFVCGNTTPFEMVELKFLIRVPFDCWRQWIRHRTANVNEYSTRYSVAVNSMDKTDSDKWRSQSKTNKQGSGEFIDKHYDDFPVNLDERYYEHPGHFLSEQEENFHEEARRIYEQRLEAGVAREQARKDLPLSTYTEAYWKIDLHNLFHFLSLRMDSHAQKEIRDYATIMGEQIVAPLLPIAWEAFCDYRLGGMFLSKLDIQVINAVLQTGLSVEDTEIQPEAWKHLTKCRERDECINKLQKLGFMLEGERVTHD